MAEDNADKGMGVRGPSYPFIDLQKAVERVEQITAKGAERVALAPESFYKFWNYQPKSSNARQTMAAMNAFGLVEYVGRGKDRKVKLTDCARRIALDKTPNSESRTTSLKQAALDPTAFRELWEHFGPHLPHEDVMTSWLVLEREFNQSGAEAAVANFVATVEFAKLDAPANKPEIEDSQDSAGVVEAEVAKVGDLVECEINGQIVHERPVRIRAISDDGEWVFVEGSETGIAMSDVTVIERGQEDTAVARVAPTMPLARHNPTPPSEGPLEIVFDMRSLAIAGKTSDLDEVDRLIGDLQELRPILAKRWKKDT